MSEVKRYHVTEAGLVDGQALGRINVVLGADHDRVTAERDALQQRLTTADERVSVLEGSLSNAYETAAKWVEKRMDDYVNEYGNEDPETGNLEFPGNGDEYVAELMEITEGLRALKPASVIADEHVCSGCGSKGWTANCKECVPY